MALPWIKLPISLLDDVRFALLNDSEELLFYKLLLLAARDGEDGWLPFQFELCSGLQTTWQHLEPRLKILVASSVIALDIYSHQFKVDEHVSDPLLLPWWRISDWQSYWWVQNDSTYVPGWGDIREAVLERDSYCCQYCGTYATHVDHIIPRCQGGSDDLDNLIAACEHCNCSKGGRTPGEAGMEMLNGTR